MSNTFKIFIAVFLAIIAANFFNSAMFRLWYPSDTQLAVQQSQKYIDDYNKMHAQRVESTLKYHEQERKAYLESATNQKFSSSYPSSNSFSNRKTSFNSDYAEQKRKRKKAEREAAQQERQRLRDIENETRRKRQKNKLADLEHIRSENMKTCKFWTDEYKRNPVSQNEIHKQTSCDRAYGR